MKVFNILNLLDHIPYSMECTKCKYYTESRSYLVTPCKKCTVNGGKVPPPHILAFRANSQKEQ